LSLDHITSLGDQAKYWSHVSLTERGLGPSIIRPAGQRSQLPFKGTSVGNVVSKVASKGAKKVIEKPISKAVVARPTSPVQRSGNVCGKYQSGVVGRPPKGKPCINCGQLRESH